MNAGTYIAVFPLNLPSHIFFCVVGSAIFLYRFIKYRKTYQAAMICAVLLTLLLRLIPHTDKSTGTIIYNAVGIAEIILLLFSLVFAIAATVRAYREKKSEAVPEQDAADNEGNEETINENQDS